MVNFQFISSIIFLILSHTGFLRNYFSNFPVLLCGIIISSIIFSYFTLSTAKKEFNIKLILTLATIFVLNLVNTFFIHSNLFGGITFVSGLYCIIALFSLEKYQNRALWLGLILILLLPIREYFQIFVGVPLRLITAQVVETIFHILNINTINQNSILIFENNISNIDYPCSGTTGLYYTMLLVSILGFLKSIPVRFLNLLKIFGILVLDTLLNIVRIFILISLSLNLSLAKFGTIIHTALGLVNFTIIIILFLMIKFKDKQIKLTSNIKILNYFLIFLLLISLPYIFIKPSSNVADNKFEIIRNPNYQNLPVSELEKSLYGKYGAKIEKYKNNEKIIIKITSSSWKALHNPELCLKNQGFQILESKTCVNNNFSYRCLKTNKGDVNYYFTDGKIYLDDYYKKTFLSIFSIKNSWTLVIEKGFKKL